MIRLASYTNDPTKGKEELKNNNVKADGDYTLYVTISVPLNLVATGYEGSVELDWDAAPYKALEDYNVYRSDISGTGYVKIDSTVYTTYLDTTVINDETYYYVVTATYTDLSEGEYSNEAEGTPIVDYNLEPNDTWDLATATTLGDSVHATINPIAEKDWYSFTGTAGEEVLLYTELVGTSAIDPKMYFYQLVGVDSLVWLADNDDGHGDAQPEIQYTLEATATYLMRLAHWSVPEKGNAKASTGEYMLHLESLGIAFPAPANLIATAGNAVIDLSWDTPDTSKLLVDYNIYRSDISGSGYVKIDSTIITNTYSDVTVINDSTYYYVVTATYDDPAESYYSNEASATPNAFVAPSNLIATAGNDVVDLAWDAPAKVFVDYNVYRSETAGTGYVKIDSTITTTTYSDTSAINNITYYYVVTATYDEPGESVYSNEAEATPVIDIALEPNDVYADATAITIPSATEATIAPVDDTDWYSFVGVTGDEILLYTERLGASAIDPDMYLYQVISVDSILELAYDDDTHGDVQPEIAYTLLADATYLIRLSHYTNDPTKESKATTGEYTLYTTITGLTMTFTYCDLEGVITPEDTVYLEGDFNGWYPYDTQMVPNATCDTFTVTLDYLAANTTYEYVYMIEDDSKALNYGWLQTDNRSLTTTLVDGEVTDYRNVVVNLAVVDSPITFSVNPGDTTETVFSRVNIYLVTVGAGEGIGGIVAELGYGDTLVNPDPANWTWSTMAYYGESDNNDVFTGTMVAPVDFGSYRYAVRYDGNWAVDNPNSVWAYGDTTGTLFSLANCGVLNVVDPNVEEIVHDTGVNTGWYTYPSNTMATHMTPSRPTEQFKVLTLKYYLNNTGSHSTLYS